MKTISIFVLCLIVPVFGKLGPMFGKRSAEHVPESEISTGAVVKRLGPMWRPRRGNPLWSRPRRLPIDLTMELEDYFGDDEEEESFKDFEF